MLCGGAGTRFWPASRRARPKPFVPLLGSETLFESTLGRLARLAPASRCWVVSGMELERVTRAALRKRRGVRLLLEPVARNTAAAVAWAAARVAAVDPGGVVGIFPADAHIPQADRFVRTILTAAREAQRTQALVLIGIEPTCPDTAYGYLRVGPPGGRGAVPVRRFVEKPSAARAKRYFASGEYLWNAGMIVAKAETILEETRRHAPEVWKPLGGVLEALAAGRKVQAARFNRAFRAVKPISFDHAVLERARGVRALRGRFVWSDLGSWDALGEHLPRVGGNRVQGPALAAAVDACGNVIWNTTDKALALLGVEDLIIVETPDALLICDKGRAQDVRRLVDQLTRGKGEKLV